LLIMMVTGALTTVVSLFYYIKIPLYLFIKRTDIVTDPVKSSFNIIGLSIILSLVILLLGIFPNAIMQYLQQ